MLLISGPTHLPVPAGVELISVRSAAQMRASVLQHAASSDIVVMAAAVADYTPETTAPGKIEKSDGPMDLRLVRTVDILSELGRIRGTNGTPVLVGFAAESGDPVERGRAKLVRKHVDFIVANDITRADAGFDVDTNAVTVISQDSEETIAVTPKADVAARILDRAELRLKARASGLNA